MQSGLSSRKSDSMSAIDAGASVGIPCALANSSTGLGRSILPRPVCAAGWVITATTSWFESIKVFSDVKDTSGVPAKTNFTL